MEEALTGAPLTQEQQHRPYEVHENLGVPKIQDPIPEREGQEVVVDNFSTSDSGEATMTPKGTIGIDTTPTSPKIFDLEVNWYGFDYPVFDGDNTNGVDDEVNGNDDYANFEDDDEENAENIPPVAQTPKREREKERIISTLSNSEEVEESFSKVFKSLFEYFSEHIWIHLHCYRFVDQLNWLCQNYLFLVFRNMPIRWSCLQWLSFRLHFDENNGYTSIQWDKYFIGTEREQPPYIVLKFMWRFLSRLLSWWWRML